MTRRGFDLALVSAVGDGGNLLQILTRLRKRGVGPATCISLFSETRDRLQVLRRAGHIQSIAGQWRLKEPA
jgi:hypothetical protein